MAPSNDTRFTVAHAIHFLTTGSASRWLSSKTRAHRSHTSAVEINICWGFERCY